MTLNLPGAGEVTGAIRMLRRMGALIAWGYHGHCMSVDQGGTNHNFTRRGAQLLNCTPLDGFVPFGDLSRSSHLHLDGER
jgi:hypothetical protein